MTALPRASREAAISEDILTGRLSSTVWALTWPAAVALFLQTLTNLVDRFFVAHLGGTQVAALGLAQNLSNLVLGTVVAISAATTAMVARFRGAGDEHDAVEATRQSLYFCVFASLAVMAMVYPAARPLLTLMAGRSEAVVDPATTYLLITMLGLVPLFGMTIIIAAVRGTGDMITPVKLTLASALLTAVLDWVLIFGHLGLPALGLKGAAIAVVSARCMACALGLYLLYGSSLRDALALSPMRLSWLRRVVALGLPAGLQALLRSGAGMVYFSLLGRLAQSEPAMAALTIGLGIEAIAFMPGFAFSAAAAAVVGQNLGAGSPDRASEAGWTCARQAVIVMTVMAVIFFALAGPIVSLFTRDPLIHRLTVGYLRINALSEPFIGLNMTLSGALQGAGDTRSPTIVTLVTMWLFRLPLTYLVAVHMGYGVTAAWWTMCISMVMSGVVTSIIWAAGRWRTIQI